MDYVSSLNRRQFVLDQLAMYSGLTKKLNDASTFIICPYHSEKTPSFRIFHSNRTTNPFGVCYGCGHKADWNELATRIGLQPFEKQKPKDEFLNLGMLPDGDFEEEEEAKEKIRLKEIPKNKKWRGISTNLLIDIGAKKCDVFSKEHGWLKPKIYLPILIKGKLRGYIKARMKKHADFPSYVNSHGPWSKTHGLFPYDSAVKMARRIQKEFGGPLTIILVEGPRDALYLLSMGIPAMAILGTQSWTDKKSRVLEISGCDRVILFMDGDDAGIAATKKLKAALADMFTLKIIKLWSLKGSPYLQFNTHAEPSKAAKKAGVDLWDPATAPDWIVEKIKAKYFKGK